MEDDRYDGRINEISPYIDVIIESCNKMRKVERTSTRILFFLTLHRTAMTRHEKRGDEKFKDAFKGLNQ